MSRLQEIILPRNWLFGRLCAITNNLKNIRRNSSNFTLEEVTAITMATVLLEKVIKEKGTNSQKLKDEYKNSINNNNLKKVRDGSST